MITFSRFGKYGNLGNQLFQYAALIGLASKYGTTVALPQCPFKQYLQHEPRILDDIEQCSQHLTHVQEPLFNYCPDAFEQHKKTMRSGTLNITGWLQSEKYWLHCKDEVKHLLTFNPKECDALNKYQEQFFGKKSIAISIRRGDYVDNPNYELLPPSYYYLALFQHFPDWQDYNILIFSDDIEYCRVHFQCLPNVHFVEGLTPFQQLIVGSNCNHFIIANSTFSWWMAYLRELRDPDCKIIRPTYLFAGDLLKNNDWSDFYPERWIPFDHKQNTGTHIAELPNCRIDLKDTTFIIPVSYDTPERAENLNLCIQFIRQHFDTNIIVGEQGSEYFQNRGIADIYFPYIKFHRTRMINEMTMSAHTPYIINYDADILTPPLQIYMAIMALRGHYQIAELPNCQIDFVYPYDGRFARVDRHQWLPIINKYKDTGMFRNFVFKGTRNSDGRSVGGAIAYNKQAFIEAGGENENMISYAPEDQERYYRFNKLGYTVARIPGITYHLDHPITPNSSTKHEDYDNNEQEFTHIKSLTRQQLRNYVNTWQNFKQ